MTGLESEVGRIELSGGRDVVYNMSHSVWHLTPAFCLVEGLVQVGHFSRHCSLDG